MTAAGIYVRISDDREGAGLGVARQEADCRALAERLGWTVEVVYSDNDVSAYDRRRKRHGWQQLLDDARNGTIQAVIAWHPDRMYRRMNDLLALIDLAEQHHVAIATVTAGSIDLSSATGRAVAKTVAAWSEHESEHKAERTRRKILEVAQGGGVHGGLRPYGYRPDRLTIDPDEAAVIRDSARRVLAGESLRSVCADLNSRQVPTVTGVAWNPTVLRAMLMRARYAGLREHKGTTYPAAWPAILPLDTHLALRDLFSDSRRRTSTGSARIHLLAGLMLCGDCDQPMRLHVGGSHRPVNSRRMYACDRCKHYVSQPGSDERVIDWTLAAINDPRVRAALADSGPQVDDDERIVADGEEELQRIGRELSEQPGVSRIVVMAMSAEVERRVDAARRRLATRAARRARSLPAGPISRQEWDLLPLSVRRAAHDITCQQDRGGIR